MRAPCRHRPRTPTTPDRLKPAPRQVLDVGAKVQEMPAEAVEVPPGQLVDALGWSKDGQVASARLRFYWRATSGHLA